VAWIEEPVLVSDDLLALTGSVPATQVLRIAVPCQEKIVATSMGWTAGWLNGWFN
jgi:hypothetical protein